MIEFLETIIIPTSVKEIGESAFPSKNSLFKVLYEGTEEEYGKINNKTLANVFYYSQEEPPKTEDGTAYVGNYWRYVDGVATIWQ